MYKITISKNIHSRVKRLMNRNNFKRSRDASDDENEPCVKKQKLTVDLDSKDYSMFTSCVE